MASSESRIRSVDTRTRNELTARASRRGRSLTTYLRARLEDEAATADLADVFTRVDARSESSDVSAVALIRGDRDRR